MPKCRDGESLANGFVDNSVKRAFIHTSGPSLDQVTKVDNEFVFKCGQRYPLLGSSVPNLEAILSRMLQKHGDPAIIMVLARAKLTRVLGLVLRIAKKLQVPDDFELVNYQQEKGSREIFVTMLSYKAGSCVKVSSREAGCPRLTMRTSMTLWPTAIMYL